jgi:hypothetical protein
MGYRVLQLAVMVARQFTVFMQVLMELPAIRVQYIKVAMPQEAVAKGAGGQRVRVSGVCIGRRNFHPAIPDGQQVHGF